MKGGRGKFGKARDGGGGRKLLQILWGEGGEIARCVFENEETPLFLSFYFCRYVPCVQFRIFDADYFAQKGEVENSTNFLCRVLRRLKIKQLRSVFSLTREEKKREIKIGTFERKKEKGFFSKRLTDHGIFAPLAAAASASFFCLPKFRAALNRTPTF